MFMTAELGTEFFKDILPSRTYNCLELPGSIHENVFFFEQLVFSHNQADEKWT